MLLTDLVKRKEYDYPDEIHFDSLSNQDKLNYPINKLYVCENIDENKLLERIRLHAIDFKYKSVEKLYLIAVAFGSLRDLANFDSEVDFGKIFDIEDSKHVKHIF